MSEVTRYRCEQCTNETANRYETKGWVSLEGTVSVAAGFHDGSCNRTAFLSQGRHDFCSMKCLTAKMQALMPRKRSKS